MPPDVISHAVWLYERISPSFPKFQALLAERGGNVPYESIEAFGYWSVTIGHKCACRLTRRRGRVDDTGLLDKVFITIHGQRPDVWHAVEQDGDLIVSTRRWVGPPVLPSD